MSLLIIVIAKSGMLSGFEIVAGIRDEFVARMGKSCEIIRESWEGLSSAGTTSKRLFLAAGCFRRNWND